jgi:putative transposase
VHVAGATPHPDERWMVQMARNVTVVEWGFLTPGPYLIHDRDGKFCPAFQQAIDAAGVQPISLPPRSPDLNAYAERRIRSVKDEALSRLILFGERSLRYALHEYVTHDHQERPHQGKGNGCSCPRSPKGQRGSLMRASSAPRRSKGEEPGLFWGKDLSSAKNGSVGSSSTTTATLHERVPGTW